jgi:hypothetical protein
LIRLAALLGVHSLGTWICGGKSRKINLASVVGWQKICPTWRVPRFQLASSYALATKCDSPFKMGSAANTLAILYDI